ncbi:HD-GYP domain-containing protein [Priestia abyssalis]|uniref:HD-GYP domain-containing protein n=1 Tax=Priestia abyssalis TaxID=1221450 RepID=UPI0009952C93|nr:HD-GYP domain-containing protein [Priestia abyssalis]
MRLVSVNSLQAGVCLAKPVYNEQGSTLISRGIPLTARMIERLDSLGISYVYIEDGRIEHIGIYDSISEKLRREAISFIKSSFNRIVNESKQQQSFLLEKSMKEVVSLVRNFIGELKHNENVLNLLTDIYIYDDYVYSHSINVTMYALALGMELKLSDNDLETIGIGALLHDVGKVSVPLDILDKPGKLTAEEFEEVKKHPEYGYELLRKVPTLSLLVAHCAYQHHERLDGSGYPRGLKGNQIHLFGKILAIADVYDAVTSHRVYRKAMLPHEGLEILYAGAGTLFDKQMVESFRRAVAVYPVGLGVVLSDGRKGVVSRQNQEMSDRPHVMILEHSNGEKLKTSYEIDLMKELHIVITECDTAVI